MDKTNHRPADTVIGRNKFLRPSGGGLHSYSSNSFVSKLFGAFFSVRMTPFLNHILGVVLLGAKKEVGRINAWRIVALMTNAHPSRDSLPIFNFPRHNMSICKAFLSSASTYLPMTGRMPPSLPFPTVVFSVNNCFGPKAISKWFHVDGVAQGGVA